MASAAIMVTELGLKEQPITINYQYSEFQSKHDVSKCPIPHIEYKTRPLEDLNQEFDLLDVKYIDTEEFAQQVLTLYPES